MAGAEMRMGLPDTLTRRAFLGRQVVSGPEPKAVEEDSGPKEPDESREELMKLSVGGSGRLGP